MCDWNLKQVMTGASGSGKTQFLNRLNNSQFTSSFNPTVGVDFQCKGIAVNGGKAKAQIWDTAGEERFKTMTNSYYKSASGIMICFSITDKSTFESVNSLYEEFKEAEKGQENNAIIIQIGCKSDLQERQVSNEEAQNLANSLGIDYFECSAKDNANVDEIFAGIVQKCVDKIQKC